MKKLSLRKIAVLTSGGDAPGMNPCIRSIVRTALSQDIGVIGVKGGYQGLITGDFMPLSLRSVGNIIQRGGTILGSSRSKDFRTKAGRKRAYDQLQEIGVNALIVLGGDGSLKGADLLSKEQSVRVIGVPCSIDNDLEGTDLSIGFDTAVSTAVECIDKIRDTADSHGRVFVVEVMGRNTGHLAIETGLACGAEYVLVPENPFRMKDLAEKIKAGVRRGKTGSIVIVGEKDKPGFGLQVSEKLQTMVGQDVRAVILGHLQRGGSPSSADRNLAAQLGSMAVNLLIQGKSRQMAGITAGRLEAQSFTKVIGRKKPAKLDKLKLIDVLSI